MTDATTLERIKKGVVTHDEINRAIAALKHAPLSQSTVLVLNDTPAGGQTNED